MTEPTSDKPASSYHHGNLKQALVDAYIELLESVPADKLSLRKLAAHVGVAPTAVYNHFADKNALKAAVKLWVLRHFSLYLQTTATTAVEPEERIYQLGLIYYQYSVDHRHYYDRIYMDDVPPEYINDELIEASMAAEAQLRAAVVALLRQHGLPTSQYNEGLGAFACWAMAHGVTSLAACHVNLAACHTGRWPPEFMLQDSVAVKASFRAMTRVLVAGILDAAKTSEEA